MLVLKANLLNQMTKIIFKLSCANLAYKNFLQMANLVIKIVLKMNFTMLRKNNAKLKTNAMESLV